MHHVSHEASHTTGKCDCCSLDQIGTMLISFSSANICDVKFTANDDIVGYAGEGKAKRCGSVVVCVIDGQSYYGRVVRFFMSACIKCKGMFAYVEWFGKPEYPFEGTPLIVRVRDNAPACPAPKVISILDIDATKIIFERCEKESAFYVLRMKGLDTIKT